MTLNHWQRSAGLVLAVSLLGMAPAAQAADVTNPAKNPAPISLTIDGQTYRDGLDTLPGYDDYACTPIPNVEYDFAGNQIQYYDGQGELVKTANWTEWARISSYETWVAQQQQGGKTPSTTPTTGAANATPTATGTTTTSTTTSAAVSPAATAPAATSPAVTTPATKTTSATSKSKGSATKTKKSTTTTKRAATETKTSTSSSRDSTTSSTPSGGSRQAEKRGKSAASPAKRSTATKRRSAAAVAPAAGDSASTDDTSTAASSASTVDEATRAPAEETATSTPSPAAAPKYKLVSDKGVGAGVADTRPVGVGILLAVFAVACLAFLFGSARRRRGFGRVA